MLKNIHDVFPYTYLRIFLRNFFSSRHLTLAIGDPRVTLCVQDLEYADLNNYMAQDAEYYILKDFQQRMVLTIRLEFFKCAGGSYTVCAKMYVGKDYRAVLYPDAELVNTYLINARNEYQCFWWILQMLSNISKEQYHLYKEIMPVNKRKEFIRDMLSAEPKDKHQKIEIWLPINGEFEQTYVPYTYNPKYENFESSEITAINSFNSLAKNLFNLSVIMKK